jgi:ABC-type transporter MlaC component
VRPPLAGIVVHSQIIKSTGEPVEVDCEVATRRSEFAAILRNEGIDGLIAALNRMANMLTGTTAKAL